MLHRYWLVTFFCVIFSSFLFAGHGQLVAYYQGVWVRNTNEKAPSNNELSKVIIEHPHQDWLINVYQHCQQEKDCLIASVSVKEGADSNKLYSLAVSWQKQFPQTKHVILLYQLVLTPQDKTHIGWKILVRDEQNLKHLMTSLHGVLIRKDSQLEFPPTPDVQSGKATSDLEKLVKNKSVECQDLKVSCVVAKNANVIVGSFTEKQRKVDISPVPRCLPWLMKSYDADNIALLFKSNNSTCMQKWPVRCSDHQCAAILQNFNELGKINPISNSR